MPSRKAYTGGSPDRSGDGCAAHGAAADCCTKAATADSYALGTSRSRSGRSGRPSCTNMSASSPSSSGQASTSPSAQATRLLVADPRAVSGISRRRHSSATCCATSSSSANPA